MATGKITVAAVNKKGAVSEQQTAFNRSLERASTFTQRTDERALSTIQQNQAAAGASLLGSMTRVAEQTDRANAQFLNSRFTNFKEAQDFQNQQFLRRGQRAIEQDKQTTDLNNSLESSARSFNQQSREKTLQGLAQLSGKVGEIIDERVKAYNKGQYDEAYNNALMRGFDLSAQDMNTFAQVEGQLESAAVQEGQSNALLAETNIIQAEDQRKNSPVLKGWAALGDAKGRVAAVAANWQLAIDLFMDSNDPLIPDPTNPNGGLISPKALAQRGPAETMAAIQAGTAMLLKQFGVQGINPAILAKDLLPQVQASNANLARQIVTQNRNADQEEAREKVVTSIASELFSLDTNDSVSGTDFLNRKVTDLMAAGLKRSDANEIVIRQAVGVAVARKDEAMLNLLGVSNISNTEPHLLTWEDRYDDIFQAGADRLQATLKADEEFERAATEALIPQIQQRHGEDLAAAGADQQAIQAANEKYREDLKALAPMSKTAADLYQREVGKALTSSDQIYGRLVDQFNRNEYLPTQTELQAMVDNQQLTKAEAADLNARRGPNVGDDVMQSNEAFINRQSRALFIEQIVQKAGLDTVGKLGSAGEEAMNTLRMEMMSHIGQWANGLGRVPSGSEISAEISRFGREVLKDEAYQIKTRSVKQGFGNPDQVLFEGMARPGALSQRLSVVPNDNSSNGKSADQRAAAVGTIIPATVTQNSWIDREELEANIDALKGGGQLTPRMQELVTRTGIPATSIAQQQAQVNGMPTAGLDNTPEVQEFRQNQEIDPQTAAIIRHPNTSPIRASRARIQLERFKGLQRLREEADRARATMGPAGRGISDPQGAQGATVPTLSGGMASTQALMPVLDLIAGPEAGAQGYNAVNRGRSGDTPNGLSSLTGKNATQMTIGEVMALQANGGINAAGRYQIIGSTMHLALRGSGLSRNDLFNEANQDKLGAALLVNGQRPKLAAYLMGRSDDLNGARDDASNEWAALQNSSGGSALAGIGGNRASVGPGRTAQALQEARRLMAQQSQPAGFTNNQTANRIASGRMISTAPGMCVTAVLETLQANGIPNPPATGNDAGNNPRGLAVQLANDFGWKPLPIGRPTTLSSPYGNSQVNAMSLNEYRQAVNSGQVPSGAIVFQTRHSDWNGTSSGSRGFDSAIAKNGGRNLWNGSMNGDSIYSNTQQVFVLVPSN